MRIRTILAAIGIFAVAVVGPPAAAAPGESPTWQESGIADAMMCDLDGDGSASEYLATGSVLYFERLTVDGVGVTHGVLAERLDNLEYYSQEADDSIYVSGKTRYTGTLTGEGETLWLDDGSNRLRYRIMDAPGGDLIGTVAGTARFIDGVIDEDSTRLDIDGPCGRPYEPAE